MKAHEKKQAIFGVMPVLEALKAFPQRIEKILLAEGRSGKVLSEICELARIHHVPFQRVSRQILGKYVSESTNHQGIIALMASYDYHDEDELFAFVVSKNQPLCLILDGIEDPRNFGAILRTAECAGVDAVFIPERRAVGLTETVAKTSAGAIFDVKVARSTNINRLIDRFKRQNFWVVGADAEAKMLYTDWDWTQSTALVLGSEGKGLHELTKKKCDLLVKIPMFGKVRSLNVSVAAGVILYEIIRQRNSQKR
ncbi:MAG: 23S rRNA (guanosine(2251)-2'-O)-methyltransferase RlmB [Acidobacteria bacterium]|nr:MAG: 23S rRNA (guanosine(2251)-2'-O)-methyltransferase RlmB [Acidobacteriota bacterium]